MSAASVYPTVVVGNVSAAHQAVEDQCLHACQAAEPTARGARACRAVDCLRSGGVMTTTHRPGRGPGSMSAAGASRLGHSPPGIPLPNEGTSRTLECGRRGGTTVVGPKSGERWDA